jgi:predicted  nucleic acid-binding Zn-ribbon protein
MALSATPEQQRALLEVQAHDTAIMQLEHKRKNLPEIAQVRELEIEVGQNELRLTAAQTQIADLTLEQNKAEADVEQVAAREERDRARMDSGALGAKDLENLQHELGALARRRQELEDVELEVMERLESATKSAAELAEILDQARSNLAQVTELCDSKLAEIDQQIAVEKEERIVPAINAGKDLMGFYDKVREGQGGFGAAALIGDTCQGCNVSMNGSDLAKIRSLAPEAVVRCEDCRRILVRS